MNTKDLQGLLRYKLATLFYELRHKATFYYLYSNEKVRYLFCFNFLLYGTLTTESVLT